MKFYVYVIFRRNGVPCYVGKGAGGRWAKHVSKARNPHLRKIYEQAGGDLPVIKVQEGLTETEAFALEVSLIAAIGRKKHGGSLVNFTDGGDGPSGWEHTPEARAAMSAAGKKRMADPEYLARVTAASKKTRATPEYSAKRSILSKRIMENMELRFRISASKIASYEANPDIAEAISIATKAAMATDKVRAKISAAQKKRFQNSEELAKLSRINLGRKQSAEEKEKRAASLRGQKRSPEQREKMSAWQIGRKMSDEAKAKMREAAKRRSENPEERKRLAEQAKKGAAKRWGL